MRRQSPLTQMLILWLLSEQSLHGYRIKRILDEPSLRYWFPIEIGSIYTALGALTRGGFIETASVEREGQRPERTRHRIRQEGREHLRELLRGAWRELPLLDDPIQLALAARPELEDAETVRLIEERIQALEERMKALDRLASSAPAKEVTERARALTRAEIEWARSLLRKAREQATGREPGGT